MDKRSKRVIFFLFLLSGMCSLLYQVVWIRLASAKFGIITPVLSVVLAVYMLGLALGSQLGGKYIGRWSRALNWSPVVFYAAVEFFIGLGAFIVPQLFSISQRLLLNSGESSSIPYLFLSAFLIMLSIFPWCTAMGATFPFMMAFIKQRDPGTSESFSFLYFANVIGAMAGTLLTVVVLVESYGFRHTLWFAGALNFLIAFLAYALGSKTEAAVGTGEKQAATVPAIPVKGSAPMVHSILFITGFSSMGMEVAWTRAFTPVLGTMVYAFSFLLAGYLLATWIGSSLYRMDLKRGTVRPRAQILMSLAVFSLIPVVVNDPSLAGWHRGILVHLLIILSTLFPLCLALGYLTPQIIDEYSNGDPAKAGTSYAVNTLGCILGPLMASYLLLPFIGVKFTMIVLALPYLVLFALHVRYLRTPARIIGGALSCGILAVAAGWSTSYEVPPISKKDRMVKRDYAATVVCFGQGMHKQLLVNGIGITKLTPITKFMAHLPLAFHKEKPESALVICFGQGTTYRSLMSWDIRVTAVELVPGVRDVFGYFFEDADSLVKDPRGKIIIDDGRRFLMRTGEKFDVITIDPPPPIEASGSSLLYSKEFYELVKLRLQPGGILQQWFPYDPRQSERYFGTLEAVAHSLAESFPYIKAYPSIEGWGVHFIASLSPIETIDAGEMARRMPERAQSDLMEWSRHISAPAFISSVLSREIPMEIFLNGETQVPITDDFPYNEYYLLRDFFRQRARR